jgi:hypothetical protein
MQGLKNVNQNQKNIFKNISKINMLDYLFPRGLNKSLYVNVLEKFDIYIRKKTSLEYLIKKLFEIDKLKFLLLREEELPLFKLLDNPQIFSSSTYLDKLWKEYEFNFTFSAKDVEFLRNNLSSLKNSKNYEKFQKIFKFYH